MNDTQQIRVSLPHGTVLKSAGHSYTIEKVLHMSGRSTTAACTDESGRTWRLKLFQETSFVTGEILKTLLQTPVKGVVLPADMGEYAGRPFSVSPVVQAGSTDQFPVSVQVLKERIIPQTAYVMQQYHRRRILLRDICPEHILYRPETQQIAYCGLQNAVPLPGRATVTKSPGFGQAPGYLAPETEAQGYSVHSDHFSLGMTILALVLGRDPLGSMSREEFLKQLSAGQVPGIDVPHLKNTPYELYSAEDRILYLVLGLTLPDPARRWGYGEIRCWCSGQHIPLIPRGGKVVYQFSEPFLVGRTRCWNERQLAEALAAHREAWSEGTVRELLAFAKRQCPKHVQAFQGYLNDDAAGPCGKLFRCIYTLCPSMDRLWWMGASYPDMQTLVGEAGQNARERETVRQLLREQCLSFFCSVRGKVSAEHREKVPELTQMEQWERMEPGKGLNRCMMRFAGQARSRSFQVEGRRYDGVRGLLEHYQNDGKRLKQISPDILKDSVFQAWLWAGGCGQAGEYAGKTAGQHPEQSFFLLLSLCERQAAEEETKRLARRLFLRFGDFAPVVWLAGHIRDYQTTSSGHQILFDLFAEAEFSEQDDLEVLAGRAQRLTADYQTFVSRTLDNPFALEHGGVDNLLYGYYPVCEDGYFCCIWENGLEVCPAFLRTTGERPDPKEVAHWLSRAETKEQERLNGLLARYPSELPPVDVARKGEYLKILLRNGLYSVLVLAAGAWFLSLGVTLGSVMVLMGLGGLIGSYLWYYPKKERIALWDRKSSSLTERRREVTCMLQDVGRRREELGRSMQGGRPVKCRIGTEK